MTAPSRTKSVSVACGSMPVRSDEAMHHASKSHAAFGACAPKADAPDARAAAPSRCEPCARMVRGGAGERQFAHPAALGCCPRRLSDQVVDALDADRKSTRLN